MPLAAASSCRLAREAMQVVSQENDSLAVSHCDRTPCCWESLELLTLMTSIPSSAMVCCRSASAEMISSASVQLFPTRPQTLGLGVEVGV